MKEKECQGLHPENYPASDFSAEIEVPGAGKIVYALSHPKTKIDNRDAIEPLRILQSQFQSHTGHSRYIPMILQTDGIGPDGNGEKAGNRFRELFQTDFMIDTRKTPREIVSMFIERFERSAKIVRNEAVETKTRMGCSAMAAMEIDGVLYYAWAGNIRGYLFGLESRSAHRIPGEKAGPDSNKETGISAAFKLLVNKTIAPLFHLRKALLTRLTEDHSFAFQLWKEGKLTEEDMKDFPNRKFTIRAIGITENLNADGGMVRIFPGDLFLMVSDGIHHTLTGKKLSGIIESHYGKHPPNKSVPDSIVSDIAQDLISYARKENPGESLSLAIYYRK